MRNILEPPMTPLRILLAEDDAMIAFLLAEIIAGMGHEVCSIETTEAGVVVGAHVHQPDILIVDARLRNGSGVVAVKAVLRTGSTPYVLMSGGSMKDAPAGAVMLQKPFFDCELLAAIELAMCHVLPALVVSAPG